jgi:outer membrane protein TolC
VYHRNYVRLAAVAALLGAGASPVAGQARDDAITALLRPLLRPNLEVAAARAARDAALARWRAAGFAPPAALGAELSNLAGATDVAGAELRLTAERELLAGPRRRAERWVAQAEVMLAELRLAVVERRVAAQAYQSFAIWSGWDAVARRLAAEDSLLAEVEIALRQRFAAGEARYVDVLRIRTERLRSQTERAQATSEAARGRRALVGLLAASAALDTLPRVLDSLAGQPMAGPLLAAIATDSLRALAERLAAAGQRRADAAAGLARARRRLQATAFAGVQRFEAAGRNRTGPVLGLSLTLPFTAARGIRLAATADSLASTAAYAEAVAGLGARRTALALAEARYDAARSRVAAFDQAVLVGAREEREAALAAYRSGALSLIELLDFERALSRAEIERVRAAVDAADALAELYLALDTVSLAIRSEP